MTHFKERAKVWLLYPVTNYKHFIHYKRKYRILP